MEHADSATTVVSLESRRYRALPLVERKKVITGQLVPFVSKGLKQCTPGSGGNPLALLPFLDSGGVLSNVDGHGGQRLPDAEDIGKALDVVRGAHGGEYASDELSDQVPPINPMTVLARQRTISRMGRGTTPVKFRAELAKRLSSARVVAGFSTKKEAADALGISLDRYEKWENGRTPIPAQYVGPVCVLFGIDANYLFDVVAVEKPSRKTA